MTKPDNETIAKIVEKFKEIKVGDILYSEDFNRYYLVVNTHIGEKGIELYCRDNSINGRGVIYNNITFGYNNIRNFLEEYMMKGNDNYNIFLAFKVIDNISKYIPLINCVMDIRYDKDINLNELGDIEFTYISNAVNKIRCLNIIVNDYKDKLRGLLDND